MKKILLLLSLFILNQKVFASDIYGGDISYSYVSGNTYIITVKIYGDATFTSGICEIPISVSAGDSGTLAPRVNGPSIDCSSNHDGIILPCNIRESVYQLTHTYPGPGTYSISCDMSNIGMFCNIPGGFIDLDLQGELVINPILGSNISPYYNVMPKISDTIGTIEYYNPMVTETDGDSLFYSLIPCYEYDSPIPGYLYPQSSTSFTIDPNTGIIEWNTPVVACDYLFSFKITEWRNVVGSHYYIGYTTQEGSNYHDCNTSGITENNNKNTSVTVFPNPSNSATNLHIESELPDQEYRIAISNSIGQTIKTIPVRNNSTIVNENELPEGIYFYSLSNEKGIINKGKFVILNASVK